jgi:hypothetical protein
LLLTDAQCADVAAAQLPEAVRSSSVMAVEMVPDPRIEIDDLVELWRDEDRFWGLVVGTDIPLTPADGAMRVDVGVL